MRATPALFALLIVVASVAVPAGAESDTSPGAPSLIVRIESGANYLTIPANDVRKTSFSGGGLDISAAVATDSHELHARYQQLQFRRAFAGADDDTRTRILQRQLDRIERRQRALERRNRAAIVAYATGEISTAAFLRQRALIDSKASLLHRRTQRMKRIANTVGDYTLPTSLNVRIANTAGRLEVLRGPVSSRLARAYAGTVEISTVYVEASRTGYSLGIANNDTYIRETYLGSEREPNATDEFKQGDTHRINAANRRAFELYPWVTNHTVSPTSRALGRTGIYRFRADHTHGTLTAYIDGGTTNVFRESQRLEPTATLTAGNVTERGPSLRIRVNRSYPTGPMRVVLSNPSTGAPVDGTVRINGQRVGQTGDDGRLWAIEPRGDVTINATTPDGASVSVSPS